MLGEAVCLLWNLRAQLMEKITKNYLSLLLLHLFETMKAPPLHTYPQAQFTKLKNQEECRERMGRRQGDQMK